MTAESFLDGKVLLYPGDCLEVLRTIEANSIDAIVTDPPYGLEFMGKGWDGADGFRRSLNKADVERPNVFGRTSKRAPEYRTAGAGVTSKPGIGERSTEWVSNQGWNQFRCGECGKLIGHGGSPCRCDEPKPVRADNRWPLFQEFIHAVAVECLRVLKPGGYAIWFGGTRTYHRLACAVEDAGFEVRDMIAWLYGQGFPKSLNIALEYEKRLCTQVERGGRNVWVYCGDGADMLRVSPFRSDDANEWSGWGTAFKPALEPICFARKPLVGTVADNVLKHGTGALNIDGCRVPAPDGITTGGAQGAMPQPEDWGSKPGIVRSAPHDAGRWPANVVHDGSDEVVGAFPSTANTSRKECAQTGQRESAYGMAASGDKIRQPDAGGSAARFFYSSKADADDRLGSKHPTVKPLDLMQWLVRLVTPKGGLVLDPFAGTGTTGEAAWREGVRAVLIQRGASEDELGYLADIRRRMKHALSGPDERKRVIAKTKAKDDGLFGLFDSVPVVASASPSNASANGMTE